MNSNHVDGALEFKFLAEAGVFEGYASVFNVVDSVGDRIAPGAFRESLAAFADEGRFPPMLWQHEVTEPIGAWRDMREDARGLYVKGALFVEDIPLAREALRLMQEDVVTGLSIGYRTRESHVEKKSGVRVLTKVELLEVSLVTFPANAQARVISRGSVKSLAAALEAETARLREEAAVRRLSRLLRAEAFAAEYGIKFDTIKFDPAQPRVPAGSSIGGQWTSGGGGGGVMLPQPRPAGLGLDPGAVNPTWSPFDFVGGAVAGIAKVTFGAARGLAGLAIGEVESLAGVLGLRASGSSMVQALDSHIVNASSPSAARVSKAAQSIDNWLGGAPDRYARNKAGDLWAIKGDRKVRFDVKNSKKDLPHFHLEKMDKSGEWIDAGTVHRYYFKGKE